MHISMLKLVYMHIELLHVSAKHVAICREENTTDALAYLAVYITDCELLHCIYHPIKYQYILIATIYIYVFWTKVFMTVISYLWTGSDTSVISFCTP
jgi:hypothetical protein